MMRSVFSKLLIFFLIFTSIFFLSKSIIFAQQFSCFWDPAQGCQISSSLPNNCSSYPPCTANCSQFNQANCESGNPHQCNCLMCSWDTSFSQCIRNSNSNCNIYGCQGDCSSFNQSACEDIYNNPHPCNCPPPFCTCVESYVVGACTILTNRCGTGYYAECDQSGYGFGCLTCNCRLNSVPSSTPVPTAGNCSCLIAGFTCSALGNCGNGYLPWCNQTPDPNGSCGLCQCMPTYVPTPTGPIPTEWLPCNNACNQDPNHPYGHCGSGNPNPTLCARPPAPNQYLDCYINGFPNDCYCCSQPNTIQVTLRPELALYCDAAGNPVTTPYDRLYTAIGCIPLGSQNDFLIFILRWALGIAGGIAFLLIVYAGFLVMTSGGDKQKLQAGKELLTAAVSGLLLLIFSVFILDLVGLRILQIPGL